MTFSLRSSAFSKGEPIPAKYTADGENLSPPLEWSDPPAGTKSFALIVEDPDTPSGMFRHWGLYNIMGERTLLPEGVGHGPKTEKLGKAVNDFGEPRYRGPAPPKGHGSLQARGSGCRGAFACANHASCRHLESSRKAHAWPNRTCWDVRPLMRSSIASRKEVVKTRQRASTPFHFADLVSLGTSGRQDLNARAFGLSD